ncbi:MAG: HAMP domain-containing histidine kinase [Ruminococcus sp.]|nr:HAMP domain-containing histidine kinase [Ruminococcus sp.]
MKKKKKRVTLASLLVKALCASAVVIFIFASGYREYLNYEINRQSHELVFSNIEDYKEQIDKLEIDYSEEEILKRMNARLPIFGVFEIDIDDPLMYQNVMINPLYSENCHFATAIIDENKNIVATNEKSFVSMIRFGKNHKDNGCYSCNRELINLPEVDKFYDEYLNKESFNLYYEYDFDSVYVNRENFTFIPHKGTATLIKNENRVSYYYDEEEYNSKISVVETVDIDITIDSDEYELIELSKFKGSFDDERTYPRQSIIGYYGEEKEIIDSFDFTPIRKLESEGDRSWEIEDGVEQYKRYERVYINKKPYYLFVGYIVDYNDKDVVNFHIKWSIIFGVFVLFAAMLLVWFENTKNKAKYAMEDYQRDLTNNLAHDIKTPLMAIGGYTENIMEGNLTESEQRAYLSHILENVSFADNLVNRTLQLNKMGETKPNKEKIKVEKIFEKAIQKYAPMLDEKNIKYTVNGSCEVKAEPVSFEVLVENLVSNAVKYTQENGEIKGIFNSKSFTVTNTVADKIDTKDLKTPFVRGDKSRSNVKGSGLGLSIADKSAISNNMKLKISCSDKEFKAEVKL